MEDGITSNLSALLRIFTIFSNAFRAIFPAYRIGVVVADSAMSIIMMSTGAFCKKSYNFNFGNRMTFGKKVIISISRTDPVFRK